MPEINRLNLNRRLALGSLLTLPLAAKAWADEKVSLPPQGCLSEARVKKTVYEYDLAGKPVEWDYPSGKASRNGLTLKGLGLQKTNSVKNTSTGFTDKSELADRFLNMGEWVDWHPTSYWALQFAAKSALALERDEDVKAETSISDDFFAFQRVGGVHPCMIVKVKTDPTFNAYMAPGKDYYLADYSSLGVLEDNDSVSANEAHGPEDFRRYGYQPKALFVAEGGKLKPVAIHVRKGTSVATVKRGEPKWEIAKFIVQNADFNYHQLSAHLGRTHLQMEAIAVATGICLPQDIHPLSRLLRPHFEGTINITDFATTDLINISPQSSNGGIFDHNFTGTMASNVAFIAKEVYGLHDQSTLRTRPDLARQVSNLYNDRMFPNDIVRRGVGHFHSEKIKMDASATSSEIDIAVYHTHPGTSRENDLGFYYPYLEDACQLWNATTDWVCRYIAQYYENDSAVQSDCELQAWAKTVVESGKILGFGEHANGQTQQGKIKSRSYLVQAVTSIIFNASTQHTAVNFPQADFGPTMPAGIYHDFFEGGSDDILAYLPNAAHFTEVMELWSVLSASQYTTLGKYHDNTTTGKRLRSVKDYFDKDEIEDARKLFRKDLKRIETNIENRERRSPKFPYGYLLPSIIPQSVNV